MLCESNHTTHWIYNDSRWSSGGPGTVLSNQAEALIYHNPSVMESVPRPKRNTSNGVISISTEIVECINRPQWWWHQILFIVPNTGCFETDERTFFSSKMYIQVIVFLCMRLPVGNREQPPLEIAKGWDKRIVVSMLNQRLTEYLGLKKCLITDKCCKLIHRCYVTVFCMILISKSLLHISVFQCVVKVSYMNISPKNASI